MKQKIKAIKRLLKSSDYSVVTVSKNGIEVTTNLGSDLTDNMVLATTVKATFDGLTKEIESKAVNAGEANMLIALKQTVQKVQKNVRQ